MANKPQVFEGKTEDAEAPFLDAGFWWPEKKIVGCVERSWTSANGECYVLDLQEEIEVNKHSEKRVSIGNLTGFRMAMDAAGVKRLIPGDFLEVECTSILSSKKPGQSPRPNFRVKVTRIAKTDASQEPDDFWR
jgi:hypothetical protein